MNPGHILRRTFHLGAPLWLVYYLIPKDFLGIGRDGLLLTVFTIVMVLEIFRLSTGTFLIGLREYERRQLSAFAWAAIGITIAFLFFPMIFVVPAVVGIGWVDPLIGEMRKRKLKGYPAIPLLAYFFIVVGSLQLLTDFHDIALPFQVIIGFVAAVVAVAVEKPQLRYIDDDFLMLVVPLSAMHIMNTMINYLA